MDITIFLMEKRLWTQKIIASIRDDIVYPPFLPLLPGTTKPRRVPATWMDYIIALLYERKSVHVDCGQDVTNRQLRAASVTVAVLETE